MTNVPERGDTVVKYAVLAWSASHLRQVLASHNGLSLFYGDAQIFARGRCVSYVCLVNLASAKKGGEAFHGVSIESCGNPY